MLGALGASLLLALALLLSRSYSERERQALLEGEAMLSLLTQCRSMISCFKLPLPEIWRSVELGRLDGSQFAEKLRASGDLHHALDSLASGLPPDIFADMRAFSAAIGRGYREEELALCDEFIGRLSRSLGARRQDGERRIKLARTLIVSGALMLVILLI